MVPAGASDISEKVFTFFSATIPSVKMFNARRIIVHIDFQCPNRATAIGTGPFKGRDTKCIDVVICPLQQDRTSSCPWYSDGCAPPSSTTSTISLGYFVCSPTRDGSSSPPPPGTTAIRGISDFAKSITESLCELTAGLPSLIPLPIAVDPP